MKKRLKNLVSPGTISTFITCMVVGTVAAVTHSVTYGVLDGVVSFIEGGFEK